ncbi:MAG: tetratricopeptide repeat protein [Rikenellaceae bacterium]
MNKIKFYLLAVSLICVHANQAVAQWLEVKNEKDERSISIKVKDGVPSSRVIVSSSFPLSYSSNMGDITNESVGYGVVNGLNSDTLYFYLAPDDCKRRITISAEGYPSVVVPVTLGPKETYRCFVFDPNKQNEEATPSEVNTSHWQYAMAQNFDFGRDGFNEDQVEAINWYEKAAEQGHGLAQVTLGVKYASGGNGFIKDSGKSAKWFLIAAQQNYDTAQYAIANCFLQGSGVRQDNAKAYYWFQQAADKGIDEARYRMANMILEGYGTDVEVDDQLAWFGFFADENRSEAQYMYAKLLLARKLTPENEALAIEYLNKSIALSNVDAMIFLAERCFNKELNQYSVIKGMELLHMAKNLFSTEAKNLIAKYANSLSDEEIYIYTKHFADGGNAIDMSLCAGMNYYGVGTEQDYKTAFEYYTKSSQYEVERAFIGLGNCYYYAFGTKCDYDKAFENYSKGSRLENPEAVSGVGLCYYYGYGVEQDYDKAFELFSQSNNGENGTALNGLALCYLNGNGVEKDVNKAVELFEKALLFDPYNAGLNFGDFWYGSNYETDPAKTMECYTLSAEAGNPEAQNKLGILTYEQGWTTKTTAISNRNIQTTYIKPTDEVIDEALSWFDKSSKRDYLMGEYNYAYCLIAALSDEELKGSERGVEAMEAFRALANKGYRKAMVALSTYYKYDIGVDVEEAHTWSMRSAEESFDGNEREVVINTGLLGCLVFDEAEALSASLEQSKADTEASGVAIMKDAAEKGCTFVYTRLAGYYKLLKDKKSAKVWSKKDDMLLDETDRVLPNKVEFLK